MFGKKKDKRTAQQIAEDNFRNQVIRRNGGKTAAQIAAELKANKQAQKFKHGLSPRAQEILRRENNNNE